MSEKEPLDPEEVAAMHRKLKAMSTDELRELAEQRTREADDMIAIADASERSDDQADVDEAPSWRQQARESYEISAMASEWVRRREAGES